MSKALSRELKSFVTAARTTKVRSMLNFAEQEIIIPSGEAETFHYSARRQPFIRHWFEAIDSCATIGDDVPKWDTFVALGPSQTGKSLGCFVIPILYHLFELNEDVGIGIPRLEMAEEKWQRDFMPVILRTKYAEMLPTRGPGSRGGVAETIKFKNGRSVRFLTGGGRDKTRAGSTLRVIAITEADGFITSTRSVEADPIRQMIARTRAFGSRRRIYLECTVSTKRGRIWSEWWNSARGQVALCCPHCRRWIIPIEESEDDTKRITDIWRESFTSWQAASSEVEASDLAHFTCPRCSCTITEEERRQMNLGSKLVLRGQSIDDSGDIQGLQPKTFTFGLRWSAINNFFTNASYVGREEYIATSLDDQRRESAMLELAQFVWAVPPEDQDSDADTIVTSSSIVSHISSIVNRGIYPAEGASQIIVGVDMQKRLAYYTATCLIPIGEEFRYAIPIYGVKEVHSDDMEITEAIKTTLYNLREELHETFGDQIGQIWVDARYWPSPIYEVARTSLTDEFPLVRPCFGYGQDQIARGNYQRPAKATSTIVFLGDQYHLVNVEGEGVARAEHDSAYWKQRVHSGFILPMDRPKSIILFNPPKRTTHISFSKHIVAETFTREFIPGKGWRIVTRVNNGTNHWLDSTALSLLGLDFQQTYDGSMGGDISKYEPLKRTPIIVAPTKFGY